MRDFKFRVVSFNSAGNSECKEMELDTAIKNGLVVIRGNTLRARNMLTVVQQATGLKDRNGAEVYEGDIVRIKHGFYDRIQRGVVTHELIEGDGSSGFFITQLTRDCDWTLHFGNTEWIEVIGNIKVNPELAKGRI